MALASFHSSAGPVLHLTSPADCKCAEAAAVCGSATGGPRRAAPRPPPLGCEIPGLSVICSVTLSSATCVGLSWTEPLLCLRRMRVYEDPPFNFQVYRVTETSSRALSELDFWYWQKPERRF